MKQKVVISINQTIFGDEEIYLCPNCKDQVIKNAEKCDIISASIGNGCGTKLDWSDVEERVKP